MKTNSVRGILFCLIPALIWGAMFPIADFLAVTVNAFYMTLIRYVLAAVILVVLLVSREGKGALSTDGSLLRLFFLGSAGFAGFGLFAFTALRYTTAPNVSLIMAMTPAISAVIASLATRKLPPVYTIGAIVVAFFGVSLVLTRGDYPTLLTGNAGFGELLALAGATSWAFYTRGAARFPEWSILRYTAVTTALGCITIAAAVVVATLTGYVTVPAVGAVLNGWPEFGYLILLAGVLAVLFWNAGNRLLGPLNGTLFMNLVPVTTFTVTIVSGTPADSTAIVGGLLVIAGLLANNVFARRAARRRVDAT